MRIPSEAEWLGNWIEGHVLDDEICGKDLAKARSHGSGRGITFGIRDVKIIEGNGLACEIVDVRCGDKYGVDDGAGESKEKDFLPFAIG